jgi:hypothetical protein
MIVCLLFGQNWAWPVIQKEIMQLNGNGWGTGSFWAADQPSRHTEIASDGRFGE